MPASPSPPPSKAWRFSIDAKNLTDRYYRVAGYDFGNAADRSRQFLHRRRQPDRLLRSAAHVTGTVTYHF